jgi:dTDP-4-dehydrorhamnose reductase
MDSLELVKQIKRFKPNVVIHAAAIIGIEKVANNPLNTIIVELLSNVVFKGLGGDPFNSIHKLHSFNNLC